MSLFCSPDVAYMEPLFALLLKGYCFKTNVSVTGRN